MDNQGQKLNGWIWHDLDPDNKETWPEDGQDIWLAFENGALDFIPGYVSFPDTFELKGIELGWLDSGKMKWAVTGIPTNPFLHKDE